MSDLRLEFHNELDELRNEVARLGAYVVELIPRVTDILLQQDLEGAEYVLRNDAEIDARTTVTEERAITMLALQAPVARDLRQIAAVLKLAPEIERSALTPEEQLQLRLLEQKRSALAKTRDAAERKLTTAERELGRCSPLRRRRKENLRVDVALQRHAIALADERLAEAVTLLEDARLQFRTVDRASQRVPDRVDVEIPRGERIREPRALVLER